MNDAMLAAASGMAAEQRTLDAITENLANAEVPGFKGSDVEFTDLANHMGTIASGQHLDFKQGKLLKGGGPLDMAIDGTGFFAVRDALGRTVYTRAGDFSRGVDGKLRSARGGVLEGITIPANAIKVSVAPSGRVTIDTETTKAQPIGQIDLVRFAAQDRLRAIGDADFMPTRESGPPQRFTPGTGNDAVIAFGSLEQSNVSVIEAMMQMITTQRAYEANSKGVQASDEMQRTVNDILRQ